MKNENWNGFIDPNGNFELPAFLYKTINNLMKKSLDYGTLLSEDPAKLRAFKETVKSTFKGKWIEVAQALEFFDIVVRCTCKDTEFCNICGGSRYILNQVVAPDRIREVAFVYGAQESKDLQDKLLIGHRKAMKEVGDIYEQDEEE